MLQTRAHETLLFAEATFVEQGTERIAVAAGTVAVALETLLAICTGEGMALCNLDRAPSDSAPWPLYRAKGIHDSLRKHGQDSRSLDKLHLQFPKALQGLCVPLAQEHPYAPHGARDGVILLVRQEKLHEASKETVHRKFQCH